MNYQNSKEERFDSIYKAYADQVFRIGLYYTKDAYVAQEISQKVFINFYKHFDEIRKDGIRSYLIRSAQNLSYNWYRDNKREREQVEISEVLDSADLEPWIMSVEESYIEKDRKEAFEQLRKSIFQRLKDENEAWYDAVMLVYCMEKPHEQVAEELGISKEVLYSRLYRARKWIQRNFKEEYSNLIRWS